VKLDILRKSSLNFCSVIDWDFDIINKDMNKVKIEAKSIPTVIKEKVVLSKFNC